jgi:hypothetical protein
MGFKILFNCSQYIVNQLLLWVILLVFNPLIFIRCDRLLIANHQQSRDLLAAPPNLQVGPLPLFMATDPH